MGTFKLPDDSFDDEVKRAATTETIIDCGAEVAATGAKIGKEEVFRHMVMAFDNLPEEEVECMFEKLTCENEETADERSDIMFKLVALTAKVNVVETHLRDDEYDREGLVDALRSIRSEIRMYAKDLDLYDQSGQRRQATTPIARAVRDLKFPWES